ncbi:hypothetical protein HPB52_007226 [Rhipicephalus sanguineus]|uniref:Peptidase M13 N-terminal domain-containing protein n=1 Tax=Rhipicephalus sanguineus TaxID=34632 RepID=A0A9D4SVS5_RHISA|nr:hypothetical protein HPB52_007226 [Rhipicephalus sanguineus]
MAAMVQGRQRDAQGTTVSLDHSCNSLYGRNGFARSNTRFHAGLTVLVILVVAAFVIAVVAFSAYFQSRFGEELASSQTSKSFCCIDHLGEMAEYVNVSIKPCSSFFQYVCANVIRLNLWKGRRHNFELRRLLVTGVVPERFQPPGPVGRFLRALHKSCIEATSVDDSLVSQVALAMAERTHHLLVSTTNANYTLNHAKDILNKHVWSVGDIQAALSHLALGTDSRFTIHIFGVQRIRAIHDILDVEKDNGSIAAYFLWHSVTSAVRQLQPKPVLYQNMFKICMRTAVSLKNLWNRFIAEEVVTPEKDDEVTAIFMAIKKAILRDSLSSWIFDPSDADKLRRHFSNLAVITPSVFLETPTALPTSTEGFVENLMRAREYDFQVNQIRNHNRSWQQEILQYGPLRIYDKTWYFIMPDTYDSVYVGHSYSTLLNMAVMGQLLAEALWYVTLFFTAWNPVTTANIERLRTCFVKAYVGDIDSISRDQTISHALGMESILRSFKRPNWHDVRIAWSMWRMSHSQFFHILATFSTCRNGFQRKSVVYTDGALRHVRDFVDAFHCDPSTGMTSSLHCEIRRRNVADYNAVQGPSSRPSTY